MKTIAATMIVTAFLAAPAYAQDAKLIGRWDSTDQSGRLFEFRADGTFDYVYDPVPPVTVLRLSWKTGWFSSLTISMANGGNPHACKYKIDGDNLTVDDGSGKSCLPNQPINMAMKFKRATK